MRKTITVIATVALAVAAVALVQPAGAGGSIAGKKCDKAGVRKTAQGKEYVCKKQGGKLVWVVVKQPGPGPQPSPSPSPTEPAYPSITTFLTNPSDRLPADMSTVHGTAPFLGLARPRRTRESISTGPIVMGGGRRQLRPATSPPSMRSLMAWSGRSRH